jgi:transcription-repair coupling factor (superfamily II helicase)
MKYKEKETIKREREVMEALIKQWKEGLLDIYSIKSWLPSKIQWFTENFRVYVDYRRKTQGKKEKLENLNKEIGVLILEPINKEEIRERFEEELKKKRKIDKEEMNQRIKEAMKKPELYRPE